MTEDRQEERERRLERLRDYADEIATWPSWKLRAGYAQPETVHQAEERERLEAQQGHGQR